MELMVFVLTVWRLPRGCGRVGLIWLLALKLQHIEFQIGRVFRGFRHLTCSRFFRMSHTLWKKGSGVLNIIVNLIKQDGAYDVIVTGLTSGQGYNVTVQVMWQNAGNWSSDPATG